MKVIAIAVAAAAIGVPGAGAAGSLSGLDQSWLKGSAQGDIFEVAGGKIALKKSRDKAFKTLAKRLIKDHTKSLGDARKLAAKYGVKLESSATPSQQWELQVVSSFTAKQFDHWYSSLEVKDHVQDIQETGDEARNGSNGDVTSDVRAELPMLKMHLRLAEAALKTAR
jgi:putative membrane protein